MRWMISVLILMNLLLAMWQVFYDKQDDIATPVPPADVGDLRLLSEREPGAAVPPDAAAAQSTEEAPVQVMPKSLPVAPIPKQTVAETPREAEPDVAPEPQASPTSVAVTEKPSGAPLPQSTGLTKPQQDETPATPETSKRRSTVTAAPPAKSCWQLPVQESREEAEKVSKQLPLDTRLLGVVEQTVSEPNGYYVMIPAAPNVSSARRTVEKLDKKGISDTWIVPNGELRNAISLGLFSSEQNAQTMVKELAEKDIEAIIRPRNRQITGYAVQLQAPADIAEARLKRLVPGRPRLIDCP